MSDGEDESSVGKIIFFMKAIFYSHPGWNYEKSITIVDPIMRSILLLINKQGDADYQPNLREEIWGGAPETSTQPQSR